MLCVTLPRTSVHNAIFNGSSGERNNAEEAYGGLPLRHRPRGPCLGAVDDRASVHFTHVSAFGGPACAQFLKNGVILPNTQTLLPVMAADVAAARIELDKVLGAQ